METYNIKIRFFFQLIYFENFIKTEFNNKINI